MAWLAGLDTCSVALFAGSAGLLLAQLAARPPLPWWPLLALAALAGVCVADLATGITHWCFDRFFAESTPGLGATFVQPFREHHRDPGSIADHGFLEVSGNNALALTPVLWLSAPLAPCFGVALAETLLLGFLLTAVTAAFFSNSIHRWAHARRVPAPVRWLQRRGWILSPARHALHHRGAHDRAYCVTTGWLNPLLDDREVFPALERALRGARPRRLRS